MELRKCNFEDMDLKRFIKSYKEDLKNYLVNSNGKQEKLYNINLKDNLVISQFKLEQLEEILSCENSTVYLPITTAIYDDLVIINGDKVDLNDGLEAEYVEGLTYMPTSGRLIDIGDLSVSINTRAGIILSIKNNNIVVSLAEGKVDRELNLKSFKTIGNGGIVSIEVKKYLDEKLVI